MKAMSHAILSVINPICCQDALKAWIAESRSSGKIASVAIWARPGRLLWDTYVFCGICDSLTEA